MQNQIASFRAALDARPVSRYQWLLLLLLALLLVTDGYDAQVLGYVVPALAQDWGLEKAAFGPVFSANLLGLTLLFSLVSNYAQYYFSGPTLFGGLSGVLYGLLGHCWIYQLLAPNPIYRLPRGVLVMMLVWLLLCLSGLVSMIGFGEIANAAHVGGLLIGCLTGLLGGLYSRRRAL